MVTKEEAEKEVLGFPKEPDWFCPLVNAMCNPKCYCYIKAKAIKPSYSEDWSARQAYCDNAMFTETTIQY